MLVCTPHRPPLPRQQVTCSRSQLARHGSKRPRGELLCCRLRVKPTSGSWPSRSAPLLPAGFHCVLQAQRAYMNSAGDHWCCWRPCMWLQGATCVPVLS